MHIRAEIYGNAQVYENALIYGNAEVYDKACVLGSSQVYDNVHVYEKAIVKESSRNSAFLRNGSPTNIAADKTFGPINTIDSFIGALLRMYDGFAHCCYI